jgi:hypothetical protein
MLDAAVPHRCCCAALRCDSLMLSQALRCDSLLLL